MNVKEEIVKRFTFIFWGLIVAGVISILVSMSYMFIFSEHYHEKSTAIGEKDIEAFRGNILDINGRVICTNSVLYDIKMDPKTEYINKLTESERNNKFDSLATQLSELFKDKSKEEYLKIIQDARTTNNRNVKIHNDVNYMQFKELKEMPLFNLHPYSGGFISVQKNSRKSFSDSLARRTIGIEGENGNYVGIEKLMNGKLAGTNGKQIAQNLSNGYTSTIKVIKQPENGSDIISTIDINMQDIVEEIVRKRLIELQAKSGVAILMEVETGEIRAIVNLRLIDSVIYAETKNMAIGDKYEPGSVMKLISFMIAFEKDPSLDLGKIINTGNGIWKDRKLTVKDYNYKTDGTGGFGKISVQKVFELSSNVGTSKIIHSIFENKDQEFVNKLIEYGFNDKLNLGLEAEPIPEVKIPGNSNFWYGSVRQMSLGYEISVTPMHIITFYNAVANNGVMVKPMFVKEVRQNGQLEDGPFKPKIINSKICSDQTLNKCKILLEGVVNNGTGFKYVHSDIVNIAGKSGTSQKYQKGQGYNRTIHNTTFVGYFPAENPKYTCLVWFSEPKNHKSGSMAAGPVLKEIAEEIYTFDYDLHHDQFVLNEMQKVKSTPKAAVSFAGFLKNALTAINISYSPNKTTWVTPTENGNDIVLQPMHIEKNVMPDVRGMNARDAVYILENYKLNINIEGAGRVVKQSIAPGTKIDNNKNITLKLSM
ncbi:MAG: transpeptidase family protein [Bacteroidales bacterium]|nr:transpeptidase family protein [Bacteroidales bacterium]